MIQVAPQMRIFLAVEPADFRKGIDGLAQICRGELESDPFSGALFVFRNRRATALKVLAYDGQGFWMCYKRLSRGHFKWWPTRGEGRSCRLDAHDLQLLLWNGDPSASRVAPPWRALAGH
jgi:transposase